MMSCRRQLRPTCSKSSRPSNDHRMNKPEPWTMPKGDSARVSRADARLREISGFQNLLTGGGAVCVLGIDVAERIIAILGGNSHGVELVPPSLCRVCGGPIVGKRAGAIYCKHACRELAYRRRRVTDNSTSVTRTSCCVLCGEALRGTITWIGGGPGHLQCVQKFVLQEPRRIAAQHRSTDACTSKV
jgi:predicted nucleic acid-binding Zn ribbon protein